MVSPPPGEVKDGGPHVPVRQEEEDPDEEGGVGKDHHSRPHKEGVDKERTELTSTLEDGGPDVPVRDDVVYRGEHTPQGGQEDNDEGDIHLTYGRVAEAGRIRRHKSPAWDKVVWHPD